MAAVAPGFTVTLDGREFALDIPNKATYRESYYKKYPQKRFVPSEQGGEFWTDWTMPSWHGGERLQRILSPDDLAAFRYHDAEGLDQATLAKWGELRLCSSITRSLAVQSTSMPMTVSSDGTKLIVGLSVSPYVKTWTYAAGWANASSVASSGTVTDLITAGATYYGVRNGHVLTSTDADTWTEVGSYSTAVGVAYVNGDLFVAKTDGLYNHTESESISTEPLAFVAGYRENVYAGRDRRLFRYDGRAFYLYDELPQGFNMTALIPYRNVLLILGYFKIRTGYRGAVYYIISGSENHLYSLGDYSADHRIYACAGGDDEIFFSNPDRGGADRYDLEKGGITNGPIWGATGAIPFKAMAVCEGYLWVGRYDNASATDGIWYADLASPSAFKTSGWLTTAEYDFGWSNDVKLFGSISLEYRSLVQGQLIDVDYSIDGGTTYYDAGTAAAASSTSDTFVLDNVTGTTIKVKLTFTGPGTSTPTLTKLVVRAAPCTDEALMWDLNIQVTKQHGGTAAIDDLWAAWKKRSQLDFTDRDGQYYKVIIEEAVEDPDADPTRANARINLRLRQVT